MSPIVEDNVNIGLPNHSKLTILVKCKISELSEFGGE
jgi:hypothetical protein